MVEIAYMVGAFATLFLIASIALWGSLRRPASRPPFSRVQVRTGPAERSAQLLIAAVSLSALAAVLAVAAFFST